MAAMSRKRLGTSSAVKGMYLTLQGKELAAINADGCPAGIALAKADDLETWEFDISVLGDETIYRVGRSPFLIVYLLCEKGETFRLRLKFGPRYPIESPEVCACGTDDVPADMNQVTFVVNSQFQAPMMNHVYSNVSDRLLFGRLSARVCEQREEEPFSSTGQVIFALPFLVCR
jgi:hypothetical protein